MAPLSSPVVVNWLSCRGELPRAGRSLLDRCAEALQDAGPTAVDVPAQRGAGFRSHLLELAMLKFDQRCFGTFDREAHFDLRADSRVRLPMAVDVPADNKAVRRIPKENL